MKEFDPKDQEHQSNFNNNEKIVKKGFWSKTKKIAAKVPFVLDAATMYYCALDQKTPLWAKGIAFGALAYVINPFDLMPDAIPVLGLTDDAAAVIAGTSAIGKQVTDEHKKNAAVAMLGINEN